MVEGTEMALGASSPISDEQPTVERCVLALAGRCDGASTWDGAGYNKYDAPFGHSLARQIESGGGSLTLKQRRAAYRMLRKYRNQLGGMGLDYALIAPVVEEDRPTSAPTDSIQESTAGLPPRPKGDGVSATIEHGRIFLRTPFRYKDVCKGLPGRKWNPDAKAWSVPGTATSADNVRRAFAMASVYGDEGYQGLLDEHDAQKVSAAHKTATDLPPVPGSKTDAWMHQRQAFWFAKDRPAAMLAMDMGTGKSKVTVDLCTANGAERVLIVCPVAVVPVWSREFRMHAGREWHVKALTGSVADRTEQAEAMVNGGCTCGKPHAVVINYEATWRDPFKTWASRQDWDYLVLDESHRIKAPGGVTSKACYAFAKSARRRLALTGTPFPQSPLDIFAQYRSLDPEVFGLSYTAFLNRYAVRGGYQGHEILGLQNEDELNERFYSMAFRVEADDVLDLPESLDVTRSCSLSSKAAKVYRQVESELYADLSEWRNRGADDESEITAPNVLVKMLRLQQITGGSVNDDAGHPLEIDDSKAKLLADVMEDIDPAHGIAVFCRFRHDLAVVRRVAEGLGMTYGEVSGGQNDLDEDAKMPQSINVMGVQIQSGGVGVDLTRCRYGIYYSLGYSLSDYLQSRRRLVRPGQEHEVLFVHLTAGGTIDEQVYGALADRQEVVEYVMDEAGVGRH